MDNFETVLEHIQRKEDKVDEIRKHQLEIMRDSSSVIPGFKAGDVIRGGSRNDLALVVASYPVWSPDLRGVYRIIEIRKVLKDGTLHSMINKLKTVHTSEMSRWEIADEEDKKRVLAANSGSVTESAPRIIS